MSEGLDTALQLGVGAGYLEALLGATTGAGVGARVEAGYRPRTNLGLFGYGQWQQGDGASCGVGARLTF